jgi:hypothetical protein
MPEYVYLKETKRSYSVAQYVRIHAAKLPILIHANERKLMYRSRISYEQHKRHLCQVWWFPVWRKRKSGSHTYRTFWRPMRHNICSFIYSMCIFYAKGRRSRWINRWIKNLYVRYAALLQRLLIEYLRHDNWMKQSWLSHRTWECIVEYEGGISGGTHEDSWCYFLKDISGFQDSLNSWGGDHRNFDTWSMIWRLIDEKTRDIMWAVDQPASQAVVS